MVVESSRVAAILGFSEALAPRVGPPAIATPPSPSGAEPSPTLLVEQAVREGLPKTALMSVVRLIEPDTTGANELAYAVVPKSSLARRETLTPEQSEKTERLARLFALSEAVLGGQEAARAFLHRPHPELGGRRPLDAALTELGGRSVERVLYSIEYGLPV
jgi:putative toxin-antitoxin system antitoxin component (TIGR02293 family)